MKVLRNLGNILATGHPAKHEDIETVDAGGEATHAIEKNCPDLAFSNHPESCQAVGHKQTVGNIAKSLLAYGGVKQMAVTSSNRIEDNKVFIE